MELRQLQRELGERIRKTPTPLNEYGFDPYGFHPEEALSKMPPVLALYRYYFRVENHGIENVPPGPVLLIANHAGQLPFDGMMLTIAMLLEAEPPRIVRGMGEFFIPRLPWLGTWAARGGMMVGTPENCRTMLEDGECVMVFPEGAHGINKPFSKRYQLERFGLGFMRLALETGTPIVPVAFIGSEEQNPGIANLESVGRAIGMPSLPITVGFPWLGPLGLLPMPTKYHIHYGAPLRFDGDANDEDSVIQGKVNRVRAAIEAMFETGLRERKGIFT
ncbi:MAG: acyltransferase family protein [Myxococcales bacterium]|nr:acyltransferase family protein [Myxococcales bacterium]